ncbi:MAG: HEAT repeat domain-containing protein, partial [Anaerolineae bacterium]
ARFGLTFETGLVDEFVQALSQPEVSPAHIQLVCLALFEELLPGQTGISRAHYQRLGQAAGILQGHLERVLTRYLPQAERPPARRLLEALVSSDGRRVIRPEAELAAELGVGRAIAPPVFNALLEQLIESRLLHTVDRPAAGLPAYELAHDYLARQIEISPEVMARKAAQELLARERLNWEQFGALMRPQTLRVVGLQRHSLQIDPPTRKLLLQSALETNVDLADWLTFASPEAARRALLQGLQHPEPELRARAARHLVDYPAPETETALSQIALHDDKPTARQAALESLAALNPDAARAILLRHLQHPEAERRVQASRSLRACLNPEATDSLFACLRGDPAVQVWHAALETLASPSAEPYRDHWWPLQKAPLWRRAEIYRRLRSMQTNIPPSLRRRMLPLLAANYLRQEAKTRPLWLAARATLVIALYLGLAWLQGWPPFLRWEAVPNAPAEALNALEVVNGDVRYLAAFDYGLARRNADGSWRYWLREGLPTGDPAKFTDPASNVRTLDAIAVDPAAPDRVFALARDSGIFFSDNAGETWTPRGDGQVPTNGLALDVTGPAVLLAAGQDGLFGSDDNGQTWQKLSDGNTLPNKAFGAVRFDAAGQPYAGGAGGLYRGSGPFPWRWEKIAGAPPLRHFEFGPAGQLYLALGWPRAGDVACYTRGADLGAVTSLGDEVITALAAHPTRPGIFYAGTIDAVHEITCDGKDTRLKHPPGVRGVGGLALLPETTGSHKLIEATGKGLFFRVR